MNGPNAIKNRTDEVDCLIGNGKWKEAFTLLKEIQPSIEETEDIKRKEWFHEKSAICNFEMAQNESDLRKRYDYLKYAEINAQEALLASEKLKNLESPLELYVLLANTAEQKKAKDKIEEFIDSKTGKITKKLTMKYKFLILLLVNTTVAFFLRIRIFEWNIAEIICVFAILNALLIFSMTMPLYFMRFRSYFRYYITKYDYPARRAYSSTQLMFIVSCGVALSTLCLPIYILSFQRALILHEILVIFFILLSPIAYFLYKTPIWRKSLQELEILNFKQNNEKEIENRKKAFYLLKTQGVNKDVCVDNLWRLITALVEREKYSVKESSIGESIKFQERGIKLFREKEMTDRVLRIYSHLANSLGNLSEISLEPRSQLFLGKSLLIQCTMLEKRDSQLQTLRKAKETFNTCKYFPNCRVYFAYTKMILPLLELRDITAIQKSRKEIQEIILQFPSEEIPPDDKYIFFSEDFVEVIQDMVDLLAYFNKLEKKKRLTEKKECLSELHTRSELVLSRGNLTEVEKFFISSIIGNIRMISRPIIIQIEEELKRFKEVPLNLYNPYLPVRDSKMFFGRNEIFDFVKEELKGKRQNSVILIHGQRRIGKTSLLYQLENRIGRGFVPVFIDMQGIIDSGDYALFYGFARDIQKALTQRGIDINVPTHEEFKEAPSMVFREKVIDVALEAIGSKSIVLMIDEFSFLERRIKTGKSKKEVLGFLRHLMQHTESLSCILTGVHRIEELDTHGWRMLLTITTTKKIGVLSKEDMKRLIRNPVRKYNLTYTDDAIEEIWRATGGHPCLIQAIGRRLAVYHNDTGRNELSKMDVVSILEDVIKTASQAFATLWEFLPPEEKLALASLEKLLREKGQVTRDTLRNFLDSLDTPLNLNELGEALRNLEYKEFIYPVDAKHLLFFRSDLMRMWIERYKNDEEELLRRRLHRDDKRI